jgi:hypothetical protein
MSTIDRWRKWSPPDEKFRESLTFEPPKPPEPAFGGFGGYVSRQMTNFYDTPPEHDPAAWREPFGRWLASACARDPRFSGGVGRLHVAFCEWAIASDDVPCRRFTFECLLRESGLQIDEVCGEVLVSGLTFQSDLEAHERFQTVDNTSIKSEPSGGIARD